jgi:uncharacterized protein
MKFEERIAVTITSNGLKLFGVLHLPLTEQKAPCALFCNGFGGFKSAKYRLGVRSAEALSKCGIATLRFDYRGTGDSEGSFSDVTMQSQFEDALVAAQFLLHHEAIDSTRFGILGRSMGGVIATKLAARLKPKALVLWAPVFDATPWLEGKVAHRAVSKGHDEVLFAGQKLNPDFLREFQTLSCKESLESIHDVPLAIIHGQKDETLKEFHFDNYLAVRKKASAKTETTLLPQSDHDFNIPDEQQQLIQITAEWFSRYLH